MEMRLFKKEREEHMQILLHYDKVMLEKASKISLEEVKQDIITNYAPLPKMVAAVSKVDEIY